LATFFDEEKPFYYRRLQVVSRAYIEQEWSQVKFALQDMKKKWKPIIILLEEPSILDLAAAPEFNLLLKTTVVVRCPCYETTLSFAPVTLAN
jgi:hypothetical protein